MTDLPKLFYGEGAFAKVPHILEALSLEHVGARPEGAPHSLYEELWHIVYWQRLMLGWAQDQAAAMPAHAAESWPASQAPADEAAWQDLVTEFFAGIETARSLASIPQTFGAQVGDKYTVQGTLESLAVHNGYHFGRIVLLRQLMGLWPPPSGGDSW